MFLTENIGKNIGKILSENLRGEYTQEHLGHAKQSATDALKTFSKRIIKKKQQEQLAIWLVVKTLIKKSQKLHNRTTQKQLQMSMTKKSLKKDISLFHIHDLRLI